jgi:DNA polymerase-1
MTRGDGTPVNAVYGFVTMVMKLVDDTDADHIAVLFDTARKTFRSDIYSDYKANRPPPPDDLIPQFGLVREATQALNIAMVEMAGYEADDLIATYARQAREMGAQVTIVSSDKDLMQLVGGTVAMYDAMKNKQIGPDEVMERFGVGPDKVIDVQALAGDSTDNVPGVAGIGVKTAALLVNEYGDLDQVLARAAEIKQPKRRQSLIDQADMARLSRDLVRLKDDVPTEVAIESFAVRDIDADDLLAFLEEQQFKSLMVKVRSRGIKGDMPDGVAGGAKKGNGKAAGKADGGTASAKSAPSRPAEASYELVRDLDALDAWIAAAGSHGIVAVDTETTSLRSMQAKLVGVSLSTQSGSACYIPLGHVAPAAQGTFDLGDAGDLGGGDAAPDQIALKDAIERLRPMLEDPTVLKVGQNIKYDMQVLARYGIAVGPVDDTMVLSYVLEGGLHGHGMDELSEVHLGHATIKFKEVAGSGKTAVTFDKVALEAALDYAAEDADITGQLYRLLKPRLVADHMVSIYETMERPLIPVLERMERRGILVDGKVLKALSDDFEIRLGELAIEIHKLAGRDFNIGSPKQLGEILFDEMGLAGGKKGKTGAYATGADVLEGLAAEGHDLPVRVLEWRQLAKLKSTYTDALIGEINPETKRVHTSYAMAVASTGRLSSNDPNLQNIPIRTEEGRKIREAFIAEKGSKLVSADYSQIELRLLAHVAGIDALKEAFHDGQDIHAVTASQVFGVPIEGMDAMVRRKAKAINFGIIYGISAFGLARQLQIPNGEAAQFIAAYFERYPGIKAYMEQTKIEAREQGFVTTLFGRRCYVPGIKDPNPARRNFSERAAINAPIQGGAADIIKRAMVKLEPALADANLKAKMLLQVHDELIFEVPDKEVDATVALVKTVMEGAAHLDVPLVVEAGVGKTWGAAH